MPYYYPVSTSNARPQLGLLRTANGETYDVFYGDWKDIRPQLQGKTASQLKIRTGKSQKNMEGLKQIYQEHSISSIKIYYADDNKIKQHYFQRPTVGDKYGRNELHLAARDSELETVATLLDKRPELLNSQDMIGLTPLHYAVSYGNIDIIKLLIAAGNFRAFF